MLKRRNDDSPDGRIYFRSDRFVHQQGKWYFLTREKTMEGPFESRMEAVQRLETYIRLARMDMLQDYHFGGGARVNVR